MATDNSQQLNSARDAISRGDKRTARQILAAIIDSDSHNADAWLLLADILDNPAHRIESLKRVLQINPNNVIAQSRLHELMEGRNGSKSKDQVAPSRPVNIASKVPRKKSNTWIVVLGALFLVACGCAVILYFAGNMGGLVNPPTSLPAHVVNDLYDDGRMVDYYIVVAKSFPKDDAMKLITYYQSKHSGYQLMNIIFYCDKRYAEEKYLQIEPLVPDSEIYRYMLYWYQTGWPGTKFLRDITNPDFTDFPTFGTGCK